MQRGDTEPKPPARSARPSRRRVISGRPRGWFRWLLEPQSAVLAFLVLLVGLGGGRRWYQSIRARRAVERLTKGDVSSQEIEEMAEFGREGLLDLFRLLGTGSSPEIRDAAGRALAKLWKADQLVTEEEKAIVTRGVLVNWRARRRYPRALRMAIPFEVSRGIPFLSDDDAMVSPLNLEWSYRVLGTRRASLESFSPWTNDGGPVKFSIEPADFPTDGPHRLILHLRARTTGLTSAWELELPQVPFTFDFDPILQVDALLATPDSARSHAFSDRVRLVAGEPTELPHFFDLNASLAIRNPPALVVDTPLPTDMAHAMFLEFDGVGGRISAGSFVCTGQASSRDGKGETRTVPLVVATGSAGAELDRPGVYRLRAVLEAAPELGWTDPDVRSVWPGTLATNWVEVEVMRR